MPPWMNTSHDSKWTLDNRSLSNMIMLSTITLKVLKVFVFKIIKVKDRFQSLLLLKSKYVGF